MEEKIVYDSEYAREFIDIETGELKTLGELTKEDWYRRKEAEEEMLGSKKKLTEEQLNYLHLMKSTDEFHQALDFYCGSYYFNNFEYISNNIENNMCFRFIYICTYLNYDNILEYGSSKNNYMNFRDFPEVFNLSERECRNIKNTFLKNKLIQQDEEGRLIINKSFCKKGKMPKNYMRRCCRMFKNAIQELYANSSSREHQTIGMLIKLLPHVNKHHNILCHNVDEPNVEYIKPMKQKEILEILKTTKPTINVLTNLKVMNGTEGAFIKASNPWIKNFYIINPRFVFAGGDLEELESTLKYFKVGSKVNA